MFINNINPVLFSLGPFGVRYYGLVYALGFLAAYLFLMYHSKKGTLKLKEEQLDVYFLWLIIGSIVMARLFDVFIYNLPDYINNLSEIYKVWNGGLSIQGGIIGAVIVTIIFAKKYKIKFYDIADPLVLIAALTLFFGKLANYTNSELYGRITDVPWCVVFMKVDSYCRHPVQIYEALAVLILFLILLWIYMHQKKHAQHSHEIVKHTSGVMFWTFIGVYGLLRFILTFLRDEPLYLGLNVGQWVSLAMMIAAGWYLYSLWKKKQR